MFFLVNVHASSEQEAINVVISGPVSTSRRVRGPQEG